MKLSRSNFCNEARKTLMSVITFFAAVQLTSSFFRFVPFFASMYMTAAVTERTSFGGVVSDFSSVKEVLSRPLSAASAFRIAGSAAARSAWHCDVKILTSFCTATTFSSSTAATSACSSAIADSWPTCTSSSSVSLFFCSTTTCSSFSWICMPTTCSAEDLSLIKPVSSRRCNVPKLAVFEMSSFLYSAISSRYDLGVVYTDLRSCARYFSQALLTDKCTNAMWWVTFSRTSSGTSTPSRKRVATEIRASAGHGWNQLITVQLVIAGNLRQRIRKAEPTGDMHNTVWRFRRTLSM
mmetsp:Transcript_8548/g.20512  ORF Transcript_8548/g.20512 Transcript_8548/m.20512 type:complete len:295 (-) Transcript_8548:834-1718(-)